MGKLQRIQTILNSFSGIREHRKGIVTDGMRRNNFFKDGTSIVLL
jgi:hypothetical protein